MFGWVEKLLRVLPDLGGMCAEREPQRHYVRLEQNVSTGRTQSREGAYEDEHRGAEVRELDDRLLVERVVDGIRVLVRAMLAYPRRTVRRSRIRASRAHQHELHGLISTQHKCI